jgi:hypothetical protein
MIRILRRGLLAGVILEVGVIAVFLWVMPV